MKDRRADDNMSARLQHLQQTSRNKKLQAVQKKKENSEIVRQIEGQSFRK